MKRNLFILLLFVLIIFFPNSLFLKLSPSYPLDKSEISKKNVTPIEHVIIISQGRRSFDNYFGTFEGANGFPKNLAIPINPFEPTPSFQNFTIFLSFKNNISNSTHESFLVNKGGIGKETPGNNLNFGIWFDEKQRIIGGFETKDGDDIFVKSNKSYADNKLHNLVLTYDKSKLRLFIDNKLVTELNSSGAVPDDNKLPIIRLGANFLKEDSFFYGTIHDLYLWNRTLNSNEISSLFLNNHVPDNSDVNFKKDSLGLSNKYKNSSLIFNGTNYFDIKLPYNFSKGLVKPFHLESTKTPNLKYGQSIYEKSYNYGFMDGFIFAQNNKGTLLNQTLKSTNQTIVMGYYNNSEISPYWYLASKFVLADNFFSPSPQTDLTNNLHLFTPEEGNFKKYVPSTGLSINTTILDLLETKQIPWKVYVENYDASLNYTNKNETSKRYLVLNPLLGIPRFVENTTLNSKIQDLTHYFHDLKNEFPKVSYIILPSSQESSPKDISKGQESVISLIISLMQSKYWKNSLFILTYSGSGGWYDHVPPPQDLNYERGFRVPTMFISPYSIEGLIDSTFYDTMSLLKFIEYNFGINPINARDLSSNNILNAFDFTQQPKNSTEIVSNLLEKYETTITNTTIFNIENIHFIFNIYLYILILIISSFLVIVFIKKYSQK